MGNRPLVTLLTDFGQVDAFVGVMKGVILTRCPDATLIDLSHEVPAYDILGASFLLHSAVRVFPAGTIHLAVVDPGVGSSRRPIVAQIHGHRFVAPDNGLLSYPLAAGPLEAARVIANPAYLLAPVSATFHGRDVFAPAAGHLAAGVPLEDLGPEAGDLARVAIPAPHADRAGGFLGQVIWIDRFGNCITNLTPAELSQVAAVGGAVHVVLDGRRLPVVSTYDEAGAEADAALVGSSGCIELFSRRGNLARRRGVTPGRVVVLQPARAAAD
jgi:S-adenosylmethionine hydrolase